MRRLFSGAQGRFISPDPLFINAERVTDPQRLNLYAYGRDSPLKYTDPRSRNPFVFLA